MEEEAVKKMTELPSESLSSSAAHFVLVHGVSHGAWCWYKVQTMLEGSGHTVTSLDLKAAGTDPSDPDAVLSFHDYNKPLLHFLSSLPHHHKVILVGHSAGGLSVTEATHKFPERIQVAVYIAATMLTFGFHSHQDLIDGTPDLSEFGEAYDIGYGVGVGENKPPTSAIIKKELQRKILYQMSPIEDCTLAGMLLRPFPMVFSEAKFKEGKDSEKVPRVYIKTLQDKVVKEEQQDEMIKRWPPTKVYTIDSDHSPFFSNPFLLSALLVNIATIIC